MLRSSSQDFAEAIEQLAVYPPGREALLQDPSVMDALQEVADKGWTDEAREFAAGALTALADHQPDAERTVNADQRHVMMSCAPPLPPSLRRDGLDGSSLVDRPMGRARDCKAHRQRAPGSRVHAVV